MKEKVPLQKGQNAMNDFEKYSTEAKEKWGQTDAYREYAAKDYSKDKHNALAGEMDGLFAGFASCMSKGYAPDSAEAQDLVKQLQSHISTNYYTCTKEILAGLGQMYVADERFQKNIDRHAHGTALFASRAIAAYCA